MEEEKLVRVLCDIHIVEAVLDPETGLAKDSAATKFYNQIYAIHDVDQATLDTALYYLKRDPKAAEKIYSKVIEKLTKMKLEDE